MYEICIDSELFEGKRILQQHQLVNQVSSSCVKRSAERVCLLVSVRSLTMVTQSPNFMTKKLLVYVGYRILYTTILNGKLLYNFFSILSL